jgi:hypothetical protein
LKTQVSSSHGRVKVSTGVQRENSSIPQTATSAPTPHGRIKVSTASTRSYQPVAAQTPQPVAKLVARNKRR